MTTQQPQTNGNQSPPPNNSYVYPPYTGPSEAFRPTVEIGQTGLRRFGTAGIVDEEFDPKLKGIRGVRTFEEMRRNDPDVGAILTAIEMSILSVDWFVERAGDSPADEEAALFLKQCMDDMSLSWSDFISDVCTMLPFGWAYFEIVYKQRAGKNPGKDPVNQGEDLPDSKFDDNRIGWRKIAIRSQETLLRWQFDNRGSLRGMWQIIPTGGPPAQFMPIEKCILFRTKRERGNPEGMSLLRQAYRPYYIKSNVEEIEVISAERDMTGIPTITLPIGATAQDKSAAEAVLEKLKWDDQAGLVLPRNGPSEEFWWKFELVASPGAPRIETDKVIQRNQIAIARSVLAQFLTLGQGRIGSYALSRDMRDLFSQSIKGHLDKIEETINRFAVDKLFALNQFQGLTALPKIIHGRVGQRNVAEFADALSKIAILGIPFTTEDYQFIRAELEMPNVPADSLMVPDEQKPEDSYMPDEGEVVGGNAAPAKAPPPAQLPAAAAGEWWKRFEEVE